MGKSIAEEVEQGNLDPSITFDDNKDGSASAAVKDLTDKKSQLNILLYHGTFGEAEAVAKAYPQFHVILCRAEESELPRRASRPTAARHSSSRSGDKGRYVGVLGAFKKNGGGFDLHYQ